MEIIFEIFFQFIFEVIIEIVAQILIELGFESLAGPLKTKIERNPALAAVGYILFGLILGFSSLLVFPEAIIKSQIMKVFNFIFSPFLIGFFLCFFSWIMERRKNKEGIFDMEKFIFGFLFALSYSVVRAFFT